MSATDILQPMAHGLTNITSIVQHQTFTAISDALNALQIGVIIIDPRMRVLSANSASKQLLDRADGLVIRESTLGARRSRDHRALVQALDSALLGSIGAAAVWPVGSAQPYLLSLTMLRGPQAQSQVMVVASDPTLISDDSILNCARALGLTRGEAGLSLTLVRGGTVADHAEERGVSIHTVRSQLRNVREKLGISRQSQLVGWLCRAALVVRPSEYATAGNS